MWSSISMALRTGSVDFLMEASGCACSKTAAKARPSNPYNLYQVWHGVGVAPAGRRLRRVGVLAGARVVCGSLRSLEGRTGGKWLMAESECSRGEIPPAEPYVELLFTRSAFAARSAASTSISATQCWYRSPVIAMLPWPSRPLATFKGTPDRSINVA